MQPNANEDYSKNRTVMEFSSNQSFNPNQFKEGRRSQVQDANNNLENVLSSQRDFMSSQSHHARKISGPLSMGQSPKVPNFKNVRNIEIKEKIAKINEASGSDDESGIPDKKSNN